MDEPERAAAIGALAGLVRAGFPLLAALHRWPHGSSGRNAPEIGAVARRAVLPLPLREVLRPIEAAWGSDGAALVETVVAGAANGDGLAERLDHLARRLEDRRYRARRSIAASAGAGASSKIILGLPCLALSVAGFTRGPALFTRPSLLVGVALGVVGLWWIDRLRPSVEADDVLSMATHHIVHALASGAGVIAALDRAAQVSAGDIGDRLARCSASIALGMDVVTALEHEGLGDLAPAISAALDLGTPAVRTLIAADHRRNEELGLRFDASIRRAPVLMALPLSLCLLPSFVLLGVTPFLGP